MFHFVLKDSKGLMMMQILYKLCEAKQTATHRTLSTTFKRRFVKFLTLGSPSGGTLWQTSVHTPPTPTPQIKPSYIATFSGTVSFFYKQKCMPSELLEKCYVH